MWYTTIDHVRAPDIVAAPTKKSMCNTHTHTSLLTMSCPWSVQCVYSGDMLLDCFVNVYWLFAIATRALNFYDTEDTQYLCCARARVCNTGMYAHGARTIGFMLSTQSQKKTKQNKTNSGMGHVLHIAAHKIHPYQTPTTTNWFNLYHVRVAQVVLTVCCTVCTARSHTHKLFIH